ncbi:hypothetical protein UlMin_020109 [Ulmus minor]
MAPQYEFMDHFDPLWDGSPYKAVPTDKPDFIEYANQLKTTEGFHVEVIPKSKYYSLIVPERVDSKYTIEAANLAVEEFNRLKGADLKLSKILNANCLLVSRALFFLTLQCVDGCFYEAKIYLGFGTESNELVMFRPAKYYPRPSRKDNDTNEEGCSEA